MDMHHQYAVKLSTGYYVSKNEKGAYTTTRNEAEAHTSWTRSGSVRLAEDYIKRNWNVTMGTPPTFDVVKVHRSQKIFHPW